MCIGCPPDSAAAWSESVEERQNAPRHLHPHQPCRLDRVSCRGGRLDDQVDAEGEDEPLEDAPELFHVYLLSG